MLLFEELNGKVIGVYDTDFTKDEQSKIDIFKQMLDRYRIAIITHKPDGKPDKMLAVASDEHKFVLHTENEYYDYLVTHNAITVYQMGTPVNDYLYAYYLTTQSIMKYGSETLASLSQKIEVSKVAEKIRELEFKPVDIIQSSDGNLMFDTTFTLTGYRSKESVKSFLFNENNNHEVFSFNGIWQLFSISNIGHFKCHVE